MGKWYPQYTKRKKDAVEILHIYEARAIFLLFYDDQFTEKE